MAFKGKGKEVAGSDPVAGGGPGVASSSSPFAKRRKAVVSGPSGTGRRAKRRRPGVLQFFDDAALEDDDDDGFSSDDDHDDDMHLEHDNADLNPRVDVKTENKSPNGVGRTAHIPFFIKEEELSGDELEELIRNRYGHGSEFVKNEDSKEVDDKFETKDATIWRVKCTAGCERQVAFCFMQKYADLENFGTKLAIISVFSLDHVKGYVFIEADKLSDVNEACKGFCNVYSTRVNLVPTSEVPQLFANHNKSAEISLGAWVRMKSGKYKGDLAKVVAIDDGRRMATVKLVPRVDLSAIAKKFGGGVSLKLAPVPSPRLISSYELEKFGPHIEVKRDRQTGEEFEILDGMMLKDGYLYKRVSFGSLIYASVEPSNAELLKFTDKPKDKDGDLKWVSSVYDDHKDKHFEVSDKASSSIKSAYDIHDLVLFGKKDFGVVIAEEKDHFRILKGGIEGVEVVAIRSKDIKNSCVDKMFTASDRYKKTVVINDVIKVLEGTLQGRQGIVKHMYKGSLFVRDDNEMDNGGFFCVKSNSCGKIDSKGSNREDLGNDKSSSHPELITRSSEHQSSVYGSSSRQNYEQKFHVGQTLRIRQGPLKGYLCRVVKIYRSDITVKLDSLVKMITVQEKFLSDPSTKRDHSTAMSSDGLGAEGSLFIGSLSAGETGNQADKAAWDVGVHPVDSDSWQPFSSNTNNGKQTGHGDDPWGSGSTAAGGSGTMKDCWGASTSVSGHGDDPWGSVTIAVGGSDTMKDSWGASTSVAEQGKEDDPWGSGTTAVGGSDTMKDSWGASTTVAEQGKEDDPWGSGTTAVGGSDTMKDSWGASTTVAEQGKEDDPWGSKMTSGHKNCPEGSDNAAGNWGGEVLNSKSEADPWGSKAIANNDKMITDRDEGKNDNLNQLTRAAVANNDDTCSWDNKGKVLATEEDAWGRASKYQEKNDDDQTGTDVGWEKKGNVGRHGQDNEWKSTSNIDKGKSSLTHPKLGHNDKSYSWDSKGKETINAEGDAWARASDSQQKQRNAGQDSTDIGWSNGGNSRSPSEWGKTKHLSSIQEPNWNKSDDQQAAEDGPDSWSKPRTLDIREQKSSSSWGNASSWDKRPSCNKDSHMGKSGSGWISVKPSDSNQTSSWDCETSLPCKEADIKPSGGQQQGDYTGSWDLSTHSDKNENDNWDKPKSSAGGTVSWNKTAGSKKNDDNGACGQVALPDKDENDNWSKPKSSDGDMVDRNKTSDTGSWDRSTHTDRNANDNWDKPKSTGVDTVNWNRTGGDLKNDNDTGAWGHDTLPDKNENDNWGKPKASGGAMLDWNETDNAEANRNSWEGGTGSNGSGQRSNWDGGKRNFEAGLSQAGNWNVQKDFNGRNDSSFHRGRGGGRFGSRGGRSSDFSRPWDQEGGWSSGGRGWHHDGGNSNESNHSNSHREGRFGSRGGRNNFSRSGDEEGNWSSGGRGWHNDGGTFNGSKDSNFERGRRGRFGSRGGRHGDFSGSGEHERNWSSGGGGWHHDGGSNRSNADGSSGDWSRGRGRGGYSSYDKRENQENYDDGSFRRNTDSSWGNARNTDWNTSAGRNECGWGKGKSVDCGDWGNDASDAKAGNTTGGNSSSDWNCNNEESDWNKTKTKSSDGTNKFTSWEKGSAETASRPDRPKDSQGASDQGSSWDKASSSWDKNHDGAGGSGGW